ncbi:hypothetical protein C8Q70DRAFT_408563 [Cubamyces menziesii]|nr:hypothetical protein C8Q70DRAFT_408563 [Cubamyces menziesii]
MGERRLLERLPPGFPLSENIECGFFDIPLDWAHPELGHQQLHYARYLAAPDVQREGTIFVHPGYRPSPGTSITPQQAWMLGEAAQVHESTQGKYDLVVLGTRGNRGRADLSTSSGQVDCFDTVEEKQAFYLRASEELGTEPAWDDQMHFIREQTHEDAKNWLRIQSMVVEECIRKQNTTTLSYMGTAATVRDLVALADFFDGPNSAINFWGLESGALVGQYLLQMFPERAGRVLLQAPHDLNAYLHQDSYDMWREDVTYAHDVIDRFVEFCVRTEEQDCSTYWANVIVGDDSLGWGHWILLNNARSMFMGWRNSLEVDLNNTALTSAFKPVVDNFTIDFVTLLSNAQHVERELILDDDALGLMPWYCGDKVVDNNADTAAKRMREIAAMLEDDIHLAPLFSSSIFPPLDYLCHLWPVRAVERLALKLEEEIQPTLATAPLVIQYSECPFARRLPLSNVVPGIEGAREVVQMKLSGMLGFRPDTCMGDIIARYLSDGELPDRSVCDGNVRFDADVKGAVHVPASGRDAWWAELLQLARREAVFAATVLGVITAFVVVVTIVLKNRGANGSVRLGEGKPMASAKY